MTASSHSYQNLKIHSNVSISPVSPYRARMAVWGLKVNSYILGNWGRVDLSDLKKLEKVVIHLQNRLSAQDAIASLPLDRIALLLVVDPNFFDPGVNTVLSQALKDLDDFLYSCHIPGRGENDRLPFYMVSNRGYDDAHKDWPALQLPNFTNREVVRVDKSLLHCPHYLRRHF